MKVLELKGYKSLRALNAFNALMLGVKMLPAYMSMEYDDFFKIISASSEQDKEKIIREAVKFVELNKDEVEALICFCTDANGVPYSPENLKSLGPDQILNIIAAVCMKIAEIKIDMISETEKKN